MSLKEAKRMLLKEAKRIFLIPYGDDLDVCVSIFLLV